MKKHSKSFPFFWMTASLICMGLVVVCFGASEPNEFRTWTSTKGSSIEARLAKESGTTVFLQLRSGETRTIDRRYLSEHDKTFLDSRPFAIIALPDTQFYTDVPKGSNPDIFYAQTTWIKDNKDILNIAMAVDLGDITQYGVEDEWKIADKAFAVIDKHVPYILSLGNHDIVCADSSRRTIINRFFPPSRFQRNRLYNYGDSLFDGDSSNYYLLFEAGGMKFVIVTMEYKPRDEVLEWANGVVSEHRDRRCIVVTHSYIGSTGKYTNNSNAPWNQHLIGNEPPQIWDTFLKRHANIFLLLCGHAPGQGMRTDQGVEGNTVHSVMCAHTENDYQNKGYLLILNFVPRENIINVKTYSPFHKEYKQGQRSEFALEYEMTKQKVVGSVSTSAVGVMPASRQ